MKYIGCHLSAAGGNLAMVRTAQSIGANTFAFLPGIPGDPKQRRKTLPTAQQRWLPYRKVPLARWLPTVPIP